MHTDITHFLQGMLLSSTILYKKGQWKVQARRNKRTHPRSQQRAVCPKTRGNLSLCPKQPPWRIKENHKKIYISLKKKKKWYMKWNIKKTNKQSYLCWIILSQRHVHSPDHVPHEEHEGISGRRAKVFAINRHLEAKYTHYTQILPTLQVRSSCFDDGPSTVR